MCEILELVIITVIEIDKINKKFNNAPFMNIFELASNSIYINKDNKKKHKLISDAKKNEPKAASCSPTLPELIFCIRLEKFVCNKTRGN
jgi:hypothetical protein